MIQNLLARGHLAAAHPTRDHRFAFDVGVRAEEFGGLGRIGHRLRRKNHQQAIAVGILRGDIERFGVTVRIGIAQDVDGIVMTPGCGKNFVQRFVSFFR